MLYVIRSFGEDIPPACQNTLPETWAVFDRFLAKYGTEHEVAERTNRVLRWGVPFYGRAGKPVVAALLNRLGRLFDTSGISSYLWICGKTIQEFGFERDEEIHAAFMDVYQRSTQRIATILQTKTPTAIPDSRPVFMEAVTLLTIQ